MVYNIPGRRDPLSGRCRAKTDERGSSFPFPDEKAGISMMTGAQKMRLKKVLDAFYDEYDFKGRLAHDPLEIPHRYRDPRDIEVAGFIASCLAYGRVELFKPVIEKILSVMGEHPAAFLRDFRVKRYADRFVFKYRFNESRDILCLLYLLHKLLARHPSLEEAFAGYYRPEDQDTGRMITGFIGEITSFDTSGVYGSDMRPPGLMQFLPSPSGGSACKRINLFLRWMIRERDIDLGIWKRIPQDRLVIPLDTHIARIARCLHLTRRASSDWKTAVEITGALKGFDPEDPLKYDFALCHQGISGLCKPGDTSGCRSCFLRRFARAKTS